MATRITLHSSLLQAARYQPQKPLLELEFCDGSVYHYFDVPEDTLKELLRAQSKGAYFNLHIRKRFHSTKIHPAKPSR